MPTCARRAGWAGSCSARRCTRCTTRAACTTTTTPTCRCSTCCSAPGATRPATSTIRASGTAPRHAYWTCCACATCRAPPRRRPEMNPVASALPQTEGGWFLTDGGLVTDLIYHEGIELPEFAAFVLLDSPAGRETLARYYRR